MVKPKLQETDEAALHSQPGRQKYCPQRALPHLHALRSCSPQNLSQQRQWRVMARRGAQWSTARQETGWQHSPSPAAKQGTQSSCGRLNAVITWRHLASPGSPLGQKSTFVFGSTAQVFSLDHQLTEALRQC